MIRSNDNELGRKMPDVIDPKFETDSCAINKFLSVHALTYDHSRERSPASTSFTMPSSSKPILVSYQLQLPINAEDPNTSLVCKNGGTKGKENSISSRLSFESPPIVFHIHVPTNVRLLWVYCLTQMILVSGTVASSEKVKIIHRTSLL